MAAGGIPQPHRSKHESKPELKSHLRLIMLKYLQKEDGRQYQTGR